MQPRDKFFSALLGVRTAGPGAPGRSANVEVVTCAEKLDANGVETLRSALMSRAQRGSWHFVFDLTPVRSIDSQGLGMLISSLRTIRDLGGAVGLVTDSPRLKHILELCARDRHCHIFSRKRAAIKALAASARPRTAA